MINPTTKRHKSADNRRLALICDGILEHRTCFAIHDCFTWGIRSKPSQAAENGEDHIWNLEKWQKKKTKNEQQTTTTKTKTKTNCWSQVVVVVVVCFCFCCCMNLQSSQVTALEGTFLSVAVHLLQQSSAFRWLTHECWLSLGSTKYIGNRS